MTERKQAEEVVRKLEWDFARINSVSMMAELAASMLNEIAQPIGSARNYARAAQNFWDMQPAHLGKVEEALSSIVVNVDRAGKIINQIREHIKKAPPRKERFDLTAAIHVPIQGDRSTPTRRSRPDSERG